MPSDKPDPEISLEKISLVEIFKNPEGFGPREFISFVKQLYRKSCLAAGFEPTFSGKLVDVYECWQEDIKRLSISSMHDDSGAPDHFKHAGILAYWLRRHSPICTLRDMEPKEQYKQMIEMLKKEDETGFQQLTNEGFGRYLLCEYTDAYLSFDFGLRICERFNSSGETKDLTEKYLRMVCYFLKYKNVSPHGLIMIYQTLYT